jgi:predicted SAM-dependent methyltransferase
MKIIVGAQSTQQIGWTSLQKLDLDIRDERSWARMFQPNSLDAVLAEHVLEHLTYAEAAEAARNCFRYLKPDGYFRIAVPDGFHPEPNYIAWVRPETGWNGDDHKFLFNYRNLTDLLSNAGFSVRLLEWFDENGTFHKQRWNYLNGAISRSLNTLWSKFLGIVVNAEYTSLIVDAYKPSLVSIPLNVERPTLEFACPY